MIIYLARAAFAFTMNAYLGGWGRSLRGRVSTVPYEALPSLGSLPARAAVIFSDQERVPEDQLAVLASLHERLRAAGARTLNDPARTLRRYGLSRALRQAGVNEHDVHRLGEGRPVRFPAFLRVENEHDGPISPLLGSQGALDAAVEEALALGARREDLLVVEYCDTRGPDGLFRKYGVQVVGDRIIPRHLFFGRREWMLKLSTRQGAQLRWEERRFITLNPHEEALRAIFRLAGTDFGRIDYAVRRDGGLEVFEINTNPLLMGLGLEPSDAPRTYVHARFAAGFRRALLALDAGAALDDGPRVPVPPGITMTHAAAPPGPLLARLVTRAGRLPGRLRYLALRALRSRG